MSNHYIVDFDFIGKDSVPLKRSYEVSEEAYKLLQQIMEGKKQSDKVFDITSNDVNAFIKEVLPEGSAKLFRTAIGTKVATEVLQKQKIPANATVAEKMKFFHEASFEISTLLNHKKNVSKNFNDQQAKATDAIKLAQEKKVEAEKKAKVDLKKLSKSIEAAKELYKDDPEKLKDKIAMLSTKRDKIKERLEKATERVESAQEKADFKAATKDVALGTALTSYFSPRIVYSWCKKNSVPIDKIYSKTKQEKFKWAADTDPNYYIDYPNVK